MHLHEETFGPLQVLLVSLPPERLALLEEASDAEGFLPTKDTVHFKEPVPEFYHSKLVPLICLIFNTAQQITHLGIANRGRSGGTGLTQIGFTFAQPTRPTISLQDVRLKLDRRYANFAEGTFNEGGLLPLKTSYAVLRALIAMHPTARRIVDHALSSILSPLAKLTPDKQFFFQQQQDALLMSLELAGLERKHHLQSNFSPSKIPTSYLEGLSGVRMREDPMLINDFQRFPGFDAIKSFVQNGVVFSDGKTTLSVLLVNRQPLEELIGTDLIYCNETFNCFVMVQYKAMEKEGNDHVFRIPDKDLDKEVAKMEQLLRELSVIPQAMFSAPSGYRLNANPFFLKFCPREVRHPDNIELVPGMYLPLEYWSQLKDSPQVNGPKSGKVLTYDSAGRYLTNTDFAHIISRAWIGTRAEQSAVLEKVIQHTLESGRAVTLSLASNAAAAPSPP